MPMTNDVSLSLCDGSTLQERVKDKGVSAQDWSWDCGLLWGLDGDRECDPGVLAESCGEATLSTGPHRCLRVLPAEEGGDLGCSVWGSFLACVVTGTINPERLGFMSHTQCGASEAAFQGS